jgi:hypothetical protein
VVVVVLLAAVLAAGTFGMVRLVKGGKPGYRESMNQK